MDKTPKPEWTKVDMGDFQKALRHLANANPSDRKAWRKAIDEANEIVGLKRP